MRRVDSVLKHVTVKMVEAVECQFLGLVTIEQCRKCPYFDGMAGFKLIRCRRQR